MEFNSAFKGLRAPQISGQTVIGRMRQALCKTYLQILTARFAAGAEEGHQKASQKAGFPASKIRNTTPSIDSYQARSRNCKTRLLTSSYLSTQMEQLESHWTNFHEN